MPKILNDGDDGVMVL